MEMATFSARKERMVQAAQSGDRRGTLVNAYQRAPADYLSAIQLVVTAANFVVGAMIGANIEAPMSSWLTVLLPSFHYVPELSWTLAIGGTTIVALIFTNVLPKHIGFVRANEIALKSAPIMRFWIKATWPITIIVRRSTKILAVLFRIAPDVKHRVTEKDIDALLLEGLRARSLDPTEQAIMRRALRLSDMKVSEIMIPIEKVLWVDLSWSPDEIERFFRTNRRSNYPVGTSSENVVGIVRVQDWYETRDLRKAMTPVDFADAEESLALVVERLRPSQTRLLVVTDKGDVAGVVTLNDVLAHIVGPIQAT